MLPPDLEALQSVVAEVRGLGLTPPAPAPTVSEGGIAIGGDSTSLETSTDRDESWKRIQTLLLQVCVCASVSLPA